MMGGAIQDHQKEMSLRTLGQAKFYIFTAFFIGVAIFIPSLYCLVLIVNRLCGQPSRNKQGSTAVPR